MKTYPLDLRPDEVRLGDVFFHPELNSAVRVTQLIAPGWLVVTECRDDGSPMRRRRGRVQEHRVQLYELFGIEGVTDAG